MSTNISKWSFYINKLREIPQQVNQFYLSIHKMFGSQMHHHNSATHSNTQETDDKELYQKRLSPLPPTPVHKGKYYAAAYVKNFYFGRVLDVMSDCVQFEFLHKVGATTFHLPVDQTHISRILI